MRPFTSDRAESGSNLTHRWCSNMRTYSELEAVFLYNLRSGFTEIRKVGYRYLQRQPNGRLAATQLARRLRRHVAMDNSEEDDSDYATSTASSSDAQEGGECGAETWSASCPP
ncbi:hypothetical protein PIB30_061947 [Stylosanthes scabra]|uniref:Uncharacterized protein n=1 Tax=Stylosanthes scabra TaxID=79078 RepID=A0ABU6WJB5_9FABA|nr:hypothetical protein [Stylosanthes scabra]